MQIHPTERTPNHSQAYSRIYVNLYATPRPDPASLLVTTYGANPLPQPTARAALKYGAVSWLVETTQKGPLSGGYTEATPWITLGVGLVVALTLAFAVEALSRRERHAAALVAERTAELKEAQEVLVRNERLAALGELSTVVGHELRNPLGAAINELFLLRMTLGDHVGADNERHIARAEDQIHRARAASPRTSPPTSAIASLCGPI